MYVHLFRRVNFFQTEVAEWSAKERTVKRMENNTQTTLQYEVPSLNLDVRWKKSLTSYSTEVQATTLVKLKAPEVHTGSYRGASWVA